MKNREREDDHVAVAVVTGASTGIGRAIAMRLAADGHQVMVNAKSDVAGCEETVVAITSMGRRAAHCCCDVSTLDGAERVIGHARELGEVRLLVNNAGATRPVEPGSWTEAHWRDMVDTNLLTTALVSQAFLADPAAQGAIVNIASVRGLPESTRIGIAAYCAAKAGVINLTKTMARAYAPRVSVNAISPGFVKTAYMDRVDSGATSAWIESMPIDRFIEPDEVAAAAAFLLSQPAITGANLVVDGAWSIRND